MFFFRLIEYPFRKIGILLNYLTNKLILFKNRVSYGTNIKMKGKLFISNYGKLIIGDNFKAHSGKYATTIGGDTILRLIVQKGAQLTIGDNVGISNSTIVCWNKIEIGDYVYIGGGCKIWDTDFHSIEPIERIQNNDKNIKTASIKIGDYAFIGGSSIILKGVTIGKNSVVGAGSVVTKNIPDNEVWGGNPAKLIYSLK